MMGRANLLCVANFPPEAGYAWQFIESLYASTADDLAVEGVESWVAYPNLDEPPPGLGDSEATPIELPIELGSPRSLLQLAREIRSRHIRVLYFSDRPSWHPAYAILRMAGIRRIVVHDHTSGARTPPRGLKRFLKSATRRFTPALADIFLAVSEYVGRRKLDVDLVPEDRVRVVLNSVHIPPRVDRRSLRRAYDIPDERPVIACACRAAEYKGVQYLLRAFDALVPRLTSRPVLVYFGDGPYMDELRALRETLPARGDMIFAGYRPQAADLLGGADLCVVPSVWAEAFGLAALEPAARGVPVVATRTGGIPEVVTHGETGLLVPPGDTGALADAMERLLTDPELRASMGRRGRQRAEERFAREDQIRTLTALFRDQMPSGTP